MCFIPTMAKHIEIIIPQGRELCDAGAEPLAAAAAFELLVPALEAIGFEGFVEEDEVLKAYIPEDKWDQAAFEQFAQEHLSEEQRKGLLRNDLEERNWNEAWESSFEPVVIGDFCAIRADFHLPVEGVEQEIIITPKMSFGTGHHATTHLMIEYMESLPMEGGSVVDFGTGTGVLAILASKLGAKEVWAVDNDTWSIENAQENVKRNDADVLLHLGEDLGEAPRRTSSWPISTAMYCSPIWTSYTACWNPQACSCLAESCRRMKRS